MIPFLNGHFKFKGLIVLSLIRSELLTLNFQFATQFMPTVHILIKGKVQGVFFRATARDVAQALDLKGWVKNTSEGYVEAIATGSEAGLHQFIEWCKKGPDKATVTSVNVTSLSDKPFDDFRIVRG